MPTVPTVNTRGGGINPQLDVLIGRMLNRGSGSTYNPEVSAEAASALGIMPKPQPQQPLEKRAAQTVSLAEMLAASRSLPAGERAALQRKLLADPRAWSRGEWMHDAAPESP